jgi:hypothetical protein
MEGLHGGRLRGSSRVMSEGLHRRSSLMFANVREGWNVLECSGMFWNVLESSGMFLWKARAELWTARAELWTARAELWKARAEACCRPASCPRPSQFNQLPSSHGQDKHQQPQQHRGSRWRSPLLTKCWWCGVMWSCCCRVVVVLLSCCCGVVVLCCCVGVVLQLWSKLFTSSPRLAAAPCAARLGSRQLHRASLSRGGSDRPRPPRHSRSSANRVA